MARYFYHDDLALVKYYHKDWEDFRIHFYVDSKLYFEWEFYSEEEADHHFDEVKSDILLKDFQRVFSPFAYSS